MATVSKKERNGVVTLTQTVNYERTKDELQDQIDDIDRDISRLQEERAKIVNWMKPIKDDAFIAKE